MFRNKAYFLYLVIYFAPVNLLQKRYWRWVRRKHETGKSKSASRRDAEIAEEDQSEPNFVVFSCSAISASQVSIANGREAGVAFVLLLSMIVRNHKLFPYCN